MLIRRSAKMLAENVDCAWPGSRPLTCCGLESISTQSARGWDTVSIDTTDIYAESDLAMKAKALAMCEAPSRRNGKRWRDNPDLLAFLAQL
jgi:hypothetical protein